MTVRAGQLLERTGELDAIERVLDAAREGVGGLLLIEGGPGLGKSSLLAAAADRAAELGMVQLTARGEHYERMLPFGGVLQLFGPLLRRASATERAELLSGHAALARELFDAAAALEHQPLESHTLAVIHGLFWLTANLCEPTSGPRPPLALLIDDAQLLDVATLRYLLYLSPRIEELAAAAIVTLRPHEPEAPSELAALRFHPAAESARPQLLSRAAIEELLAADRGGGPVDAEFAQACLRVTGGNPFLVRELISELRSQAIEPLAAAAPRVSSLAPEAVLHAVVARLVRLSPAAAPLAMGLTVLGDGASLRLVTALAELDHQAAAAAADALAAADILERGEPLRFAHPLIRSAIESDAPAGWRAKAEARCARLLASEGAPADVVAAHLVGAQATGDRWVVETLARAADESLARGAPEAAVRYLRRALEEPPIPAARAKLLAALAEAEVAAGAAEAMRHLEEALELIDDPGARAHVLGNVGRLLAAHGRHRDAVDAFQRGLDQLDDLRSELARELRARMTACATTAGVALRTLHPLMAELSDLPRGAELPIERSVLAIAAMHAALAGEPVERYRQPLLRSTVGSGLIDEMAYDGGIALACASVALLLADEIERSLDLLGAALQRAKREGLVIAAATATARRSWPLYFGGAIVDAIADAEQALAARDFGWSMYAGETCAILAHARMERGDLAGALEALGEAVPLRLPQNGAESTMLLDARARLRLLEHDPAGALEDACESGRRVAAAGVSSRQIPWRSTAALAAMALGQRERAQQLAAEELKRAQRTHVARTCGMALRLVGLIEGGDAGIARLRDAVSMLEHSPSRLEYARALIDLGSLLRRAGQRTASRQPLRDGLDLAVRSGALALAETAREELRASGARPRRAALRGVESLTASEYRVAVLAADGLSNRDIAQELFVTTKAVEYHLRHVFQKLEISSRTELPPALLTGNLVVA